MKELILAASIALIQFGEIPDRYESGPLIAPVEMFYMSAGEVEAMCQAKAPGCMVFSKGNDFLDWKDRDQADRCTLFLREDYRYMDYLIKHETAHCRGWPADHPAN